MLDSTSYNQQLWIVERLYRVCSVYRSMCAEEPCLEQYERQVSLMLDERVSPAASAWIELIVQSLRCGQPFESRDYLPAGLAADGT